MCKRKLAVVVCVVVVELSCSSTSSRSAVKNSQRAPPLFVVTSQDCLFTPHPILPPLSNLILHLLRMGGTSTTRR